MRKVKYLTPHLVQEYIDIMNHTGGQNGQQKDPNIYHNDMAASVFTLVVLVAWVVYLILS